MLFLDNRANINCDMRIVLVLFLMFYVPFVCVAGNGDKSFTIPCAMNEADTTTNFLFVHIIRGQECTKCSVSSLYQWEKIIAIIGNDNISYLFVVEPHLEDDMSVIQASLERRPFHQPLFIDNKHDLLKQNPWLSKKKYREANGFLIDHCGNIIAIGDPMSNMRFLKYLSNLR